MDEAVSLLKEGLNTFEPMFPNRCHGGRETERGFPWHDPKGFVAVLLLLLSDCFPSRTHPRPGIPSPELGELHNQAALLLLFQNKGEEAAYHAGVSSLEDATL